MRIFLIIWIGQLISLVGSGLTSFALAVWIFEQTGEATPFALTMLFAALPRILISPLAGVLVDRYDRRWLMILADTGDALVTLAVVFILQFGSLQVWHIYMIALMSSVFAAFQEPAYTASITMLVPKKDLARANGMVQMGQAFEMLVAPISAGVLFVTVGLSGIILIDFATYLFAIGALLFVRIPQPETSGEGELSLSSVWQDARFGWSFLRARVGLLGLLLYFALVNFLLNFAAVVHGPMVLSFADPSVLGIIQTTLGAGMLVGSLLMSVWGGPKRRIHAVFGFVALAAIGLAFAGVRPSPFVIGAGLFLLTFSTPLASGPSQAIFQTKVEPAIQGRVFATRSMIARMTLPIAFISAGPLADHIFEPLMVEGGSLARSFVGDWIGTGPGRGMGMMFVLSGFILFAATGLVYLHPRIRNVEDELPDVGKETTHFESMTAEQGENTYPAG
jgi:MFS family permease